MTDYHEKAKEFLEKYLETYQRDIAKMKRKRKFIRSLFIITIILSITSSSVCAATVGIMPPLAVTILSSSGALGTANTLGTAKSIKFNFKSRKEKLDEIIS